MFNSVMNWIFGPFLPLPADAPDPETKQERHEAVVWYDERMKEWQGLYRGRGFVRGHLWWVNEDDGQYASGSAEDALTKRYWQIQRELKREAAK
jgi:hypothetical protein